MSAISFHCITLAVLIVIIASFLPEPTVIHQHFGVRIMLLTSLCILLTLKSATSLNNRRICLTSSADIMFVALTVCLIISTSIIPWQNVNLYSTVAASIVVYVLLSMYNGIHIAIIAGERFTPIIAEVLVLAASLHAAASMLQVYSGFKCKGFDSSVNGNSYYLIMNLPLALGLLIYFIDTYSYHSALGWLSIAQLIIIVASLILTKCRGTLIITACALVIIVAYYLKQKASEHIELAHHTRVFYTTAGMITFLCVFALTMALVFTYSSGQTKLTSIIGRYIMWKLSIIMAISHMPFGVGIGNYSCLYGETQARYFQLHSPAWVKMAADYSNHPYSSLILSTAEGGIIGFVLYIIISIMFVRLALCCLVSRDSEAAYPFSNTSTLWTRLLSYSASATVLIFVGLSFVSPIYKSSVCVALLALYLALCRSIASGSYNAFKGRLCLLLHTRVSRMLHVVLITIGVLAFLYITMQAPLLRCYSTAEYLYIKGNRRQAFLLATNMISNASQQGQLAQYCGNAYMSQGMSKEAVEMYECAQIGISDPYLYENMALAYLLLSRNTDWPLAVHTSYRLETPAQVITRKVREWRCGTNLFFEPPPTKLTQSACIGRAIDYLTLASNILPWRLTSRWYLAQIYHDVGDVSNAVKYAQLVVNTPMKKDTPQGREFKRNAQKMLNELGVKCDDPGMVVFDIHDRKTWNKGKW